MKNAHEKWKEIPGYPYYFISDMGRIKTAQLMHFGKRSGRTIYERIVPLKQNKRGSKYILIERGGSIHKMYIHTLVLVNFDEKKSQRENEKMKIMLAGSIAGKTKEREYLLRNNHRLLSFWEIKNKLFNAMLSFNLIKKRKSK